MENLQGPDVNPWGALIVNPGDVINLGPIAAGSVVHLADGRIPAWFGVDVEAWNR